MRPEQFIFQQRDILSRPVDAVYICTSIWRSKLLSPAHLRPSREHDVNIEIEMILEIKIEIEIEIEMLMEIQIRNANGNGGESLENKPQAGGANQPVVGSAWVGIGWWELSGIKKQTGLSKPNFASDDPPSLKAIGRQFLPKEWSCQWAFPLDLNFAGSLVHGHSTFLNLLCALVCTLSPSPIAYINTLPIPTSATANCTRTPELASS